LRSNFWHFISPHHWIEDTSVRPAIIVSVDYFTMAIKPDSPAARPERVHRNWKLITALSRLASGTSGLEILFQPASHGMKMMERPR
jgi:hypothetical protein